MHADEAKQVATQMTTKPTTRPATLDLFPAELKAREQWLLWKLEERNGRLTKVPYQTDGTKADTTNPTTWTTFEQAVAHQNGYAGVGFVLREEEESEIFFMDLDHCVDSATGVIAEWAQGIIAAVPTYVEISPSGSGLHFLGFGSLPAKGNRKGSMEIYTTSRFAACTGWRVAGTPSTLKPCDLSSVHSRMMSGEFIFTKASKAAPASFGSIKYEALKAGKWQECGCYPSQSEADLALCRYLAEDLHTADAEVIDAAFRQTSLFSPKWDSARGDSTYGAYTIAKILATPQKSTPAVAAEEQIISIHGPEDIPDVRSLECAPVSHLVSGLFPKNQLIMIAGEPSAGKTWFAMMLGRALVRGEKFLDRDTICCENVIYFDRENPQAIVKDRMLALFGEPNDQEQLNYRHWGLWLPDEPPSFDSDRYTRFAELGAVMVFDSFGRFHSGEENSPSEMKQVLAHLRKLQARGASIFAIHHRDKKMEAGYRGTVEILAAVDCLFTFSREETPDLRKLKLMKSRTALDEEITFSVDWDIPSMTPRQNALTAKRRGHCALITAMLRSQPEGVQQRAIVQELGRQGISRSQTQRYLDAHEGSLWISRGGGRGVPRTYHARIVIK